MSCDSNFFFFFFCRLQPWQLQHLCLLLRPHQRLLRWLRHDLPCCQCQLNVSRSFAFFLLLLLLLLSFSSFFVFFVFFLRARLHLTPKKNIANFSGSFNPLSTAMHGWHIKLQKFKKGKNVWKDHWSLSVVKKKFSSLFQTFVFEIHRVFSANAPYCMWAYFLRAQHQRIQTSLLQ